MVKRYVITGGPGSGKTSILKGLKNDGYACFDERSRQFIDDALAEGSDLVPWKRLADFNKKVTEAQILDYHSADQEINFYDRGLPDNIAYLKHFNEEIPEIVAEAAKKHLYEPIVFLAPPWKEIYLKDKARTESFEDAEKIAEHLRLAYEAHGYRIIELPKVSIKERIEFIKKYLEL